MNPHFVNKQPCPVCSYAMDCATGIGHDHAPKPGDCTLCFNCGSLLLFGELLQFREPDPMERLAVELSDNWPTLERGQIMIRARRGEKR